MAKESENPSLCFPFHSQMLPGSPKKEDTRKQPRLLPRHSTMHLLGPLLLLLGKDCGLGLGSGMSVGAGGGGGKLWSKE